MNTLEKLNMKTVAIGKFEDDRRKLLLQAVLEHWPMADIAKAARTSRAQVARVARAAGIAPRPQGRPQLKAQE